MDEQAMIQAFLAAGPFAVAGASTNREKYGNKVLRAYQQNDLSAYPLNPRADEIEGLKAYPDLGSVPATVRSLSIVTPPQITLSVVEEAAAAGVQHLWMQPGAESAEAVARAGELGLSVIHGGACLLVALNYRE